MTEVTVNHPEASTDEMPAEGAMAIMSILFPRWPRGYGASGRGVNAEHLHQIGNFLQMP